MPVLFGNTYILPAIIVVVLVVLLLLVIVLRKRGSSSSGSKTAAKSERRVTSPPKPTKVERVPAKATPAVAEPGLAEASPSDAEPEMSEDKANEALVTAIDLSEEMVVRRRNGGTAVRVADPAVWSEISNAPEAAGMFVVCHEINDRLEGRVSPVLLPFHGADQVLVPDTLLAAIYWRFSAEVSADSHNPIRRRCDNPECNGWVVGRPNKKHCSDYCGSRLRDLKRMGQAPKHL